MVYGLVCLAFRRNVNISKKTLHRAEFLLQRRFPIQIWSLPYGSQKTDTTKSEEKKSSDSKPNFANGKAHVEYIINQAKKGKISVVDIKGLVDRTISEGHYPNFKQAPQSVQYIGFGGLVPMLGIPILTLLSGNALSCLVHAHLTFGATILSFLGGSSWYEAISKNELSYEKLGWTIAPQIIGWTSLILPLPIGILFTAFGFCLSLVHDVLLSSYPQWMKSLRLVLTGGTLVSLALMLVFYILL